MDQTQYEQSTGGREQVLGQSTLCPVVGTHRDTEGSQNCLFFDS